ncbi:ATP-binding protein [Novosphingobium sp.]|uniref:sensor histidine kinase n=1 Tax=Novosphingobium sp. TaxID=1874826 RepID=UPI003D0E7CD9
MNTPQRLIDLRHTTAFRLTAGLTGVFVVAIFAALWLIYAQTSAELNHRTDLTITTKAHMLALGDNARTLAAAHLALDDSTHLLESVAVFDTAHRLLVGEPSLGPPFPIGQMFERVHGPRGVPVRALALMTGGGLIVVVARDISPIHDLRARILAIMWITGAGAVAVALGAGVLLSLGPMRRIRRLEATAARIAMGELDLRIAIGGRGDEFDMIAAIINVMVEEIERLLRQVKGATDAIAHDLRTPLSHVRTRLERIALLPVLARHPDGEAATLLLGARDELDAVLARFRALLRMSELEASRRQAHFASVDVCDMARDLAELYEPLAEERGITLVASGYATMCVHGDERLLFEAVSNLVENAIKFSPAGGTIAISVTELGERIAITVTDQGPGIAPAERTLVLERFQRGSGAAATPGFGLGLSLVAVIVAVHGFVLELDPAGDGASPGLAARIVAPRV